MRILIGITSKNRASILPKAITSALNQTFTNKEIWVYDDASTDNTKDLKNLFPEINWVFSELPNGYLYARNLFMNKVGFDYYCSLDDDSWFTDESAILKALTYMSANPSVGALGFDMLSPDSPEPKNSNIGFKESNNFIGCGHIINLNAAKQIGYYTKNPGYYGGEEKDFCIRLIDKGYKIITYEGMFVWHDKTMIARDLPKQHRSGVCNDLVFTYRRAPLPILIPAIGLKIIKHLKFSIQYKKASLIKPCLNGIRDFFKWLIKEKTNRQAVRSKTFKRYIRFNTN